MAVSLLALSLLIVPFETNRGCFYSSQFQGGFMKRIIFGLLLVFAARVQAQSVQLIGYSSGGGGCPAGSATVTMAPDGKTFTVLYDRLNLRLAPGQTEAVLDCKVEVQVKKPTILGLKINQADFRGFVGLSTGVRANQQVSVAAGVPNGLRDVFNDFEAQTWTGPVQDNFNLSVRHTRSQADILTCSFKSKARITIKTRIRVKQIGNGNGEGIIAVDSTDGRFTQNFHMDWENCIGDIGGLLGGLFRR